MWQCVPLAGLELGVVSIEFAARTLEAAGRNAGWQRRRAVLHLGLCDIALRGSSRRVLGSGGRFALRLERDYKL